MANSTLFCVNKNHSNKTNSRFVYKQAFCCITASMKLLHIYHSHIHASRLTFWNNNKNNKNKTQHFYFNQFLKCLARAGGKKVTLEATHAQADHKKTAIKRAVRSLGLEKTAKKEKSAAKHPG